MKTFDKKDVYSWSNAEEAKLYIGEKGYFADAAFENIDDWQLDVLEEIYSDSDIRSVFQAQSSFYGLFLPEDKIKEVKEEKKWRPFTLEEFNKIIPMGTVFKYRYKGQKHIKSIYYHANLDCENGYQAIFFEDCNLNLGYCFETMELFLDGKWVPFGVKE